jgi:hypothetical protein
MQPEERQSVVDLALRDDVVRTEDTPSRARVLGRLRLTDSLGASGSKSYTVTATP